MKAKNVVITLVSMLIGFSAYGKSEMSLSEYTAQATAETINQLETVDNFLAWMGQSIGAKDLAATKAYLKTIGLEGSVKFPKMKVKGSTAYFDKFNTVTYGKNFVIINGKKVKVHAKGFHTALREFCSKAKCGQKTSALSFFIPEAHAKISPLLAGGLGLLVGIGGTLAYQNYRDRNRYSDDGYLYSNNDYRRRRRRQLLRRRPVYEGPGYNYMAANQFHPNHSVQCLNNRPYRRNMSQNLSVTLDLDIFGLGQQSQNCNQLDNRRYASLERYRYEVRRRRQRQDRPPVGAVRTSASTADDKAN